MARISVRIPKYYYEYMEKLIEIGIFKSKSEVLREAINIFIEYELNKIKVINKYGEYSE